MTLLTGIIGSSGGAAPAWSPLTDSATFWFDASQASVYSDAGTTLATNGGSVQQWNDLSGNANHIIQTNGAFQPTYHTNIVNSLPAVQLFYDGVIHLFSNTVLTLAQPCLLMAVFRKNGTAVLNQASIMGPYQWMTKNAFVANPTQAKFSYDGVTYLDTGIVVAINTNYYFYVLLNNTSSKARISGGTEQTGGIGSASSINGILFGGDTGNATTTSPDSYMCEIFGIPNADATITANALAYVQAKWGV